MIFWIGEDEASRRERDDEAGRGEAGRTARAAGPAGRPSSVVGGGGGGEGAFSEPNETGDPACRGDRAGYERRACGAWVVLLGSGRCRCEGGMGRSLADGPSCCRRELVCCR